MIPQRNISLLANRLARECGRRFQESVLERDYCLAWFLAALPESDLKPVLGFKGGTALKQCYFEDYRFSEDLDFTLTEPIAFEELVKRLESVYAAIYDASGIVFKFDREDRQTHENSYTFYLEYVGPLPTGNLALSPFFGFQNRLSTTPTAVLLAAKLRREAIHGHQFLVATIQTMEPQ